METVFSSNMHCAACKANIESTLTRLDGVIKVSANLVNNVVKVNYNDKICDETKIIEACKNIGYKLEVLSEDDSEIVNDSSNKKDTIKLIVGAILVAILMFFSMSGMYGNLIPSFLKAPIYLLPLIELALALVIIGLNFGYYTRGARSLFKLAPNMDSLIFLGSFFSVLYSVYFIIRLIISPEAYYIYEKIDASQIMFHTYLDGAAMILVIVSLGKLIENLSKRKAKSTISELLKLRPTHATILEGLETKVVETKYLKVGDKVVVKPGDTIPLDGEIIDGETSVNESLISGESLPIYKKEGDEVIGGSINVEGTIIVLVTKNKKENVLSKIISLMMEASNMDTKLTRKVDKVAKVFVPIVLVLSVLVFLTWLIIDLINGHATIMHHFSSIFDEAFSFGVSVMVISCPCALGLATPISLLVGSSVFAKNGILVNKSETIETLKSVDVLVLDKTNTITNGKLSVNEMKVFTEDKAIMNRIYSIEKYSSHPLSEGICEKLSSNYNLERDFKLINNIPGKGVKGVYEDQTIYIGNSSLLNEIYQKDISENIVKTMNERRERGDLVICAFDKDNIYAIFSLKDEIKSSSYEFVKEAYKYFKRIILLTGDNDVIANNVAKQVGIKEVISNVKPEDKAEVIKKLQSEGNKVMMVGDGVNDSIALTIADVGVGIAKGSDVALTSSDFILMRSDLMDIISIINISKRIRTNITFNLIWAFAYNVIFIPVAAGAFATLGFLLEPMYCSMLMAASSVCVCLSALTLFFYKNAAKVH